MSNIRTRRADCQRAAKNKNNFTETNARFIRLIEDKLPGSPGIRRKKALAIYALMIGSLQLATAGSDKDLSNQILDSGFWAGMALVESARTVRR